MITVSSDVIPCVEAHVSWFLGVGGRFPDFDDVVFSSLGLEYLGLVPTFR